MIRLHPFFSRQRFTWLGILCVLSITLLLSSCGVSSPTNVATGMPAEEITTTLILRETIPDPEARCSTRTPSFEEIARIQRRFEQEAPRLDRQSFPIEVPVAIHVIYSGAEGNLPQTVLNEQMDVINAAFAGTGFSFRIDSVDRTENFTWYNLQPGSAASREAKAALNISPETTLNLYTVRKPGNLGFATFPSELATSPDQDGIVISYDSVPGGSRENFNEGDTAVHEIGHWLGLYHTFDFGCRFPGDNVFDTPFERIESEGCPVGRDTCLFRLGPDPIFNFMDYSDDPCMNEFTTGQINRMRAAAWIYRPALFS